MEDILVGSRSLSSFSSSRKLVSKRNPRLCLVPVFFNLTVDLIGLFFRLSVSFFFCCVQSKILKISAKMQMGEKNGRN